MGFKKCYHLVLENEEGGGEEDPKHQAVRMKRLVLALWVAHFYIFGDRR